MGYGDGKKTGPWVSLGVIATIIVACIGVIGTVSVAYIQFIVNPSLILKATQTAEAYRINQAIFTEQAAATINPGYGDIGPTPIITEPVVTIPVPEATLTASLTFTPSHTPTPTLTPTPTFELVSRRLLKWSGGFIPDLINSWQYSDDGSNVTFHLERDVLLADGSPFNASVARERIIEELGPGTDIVILNDLTLRLNFGIVSASVSSDIMEMISTIDFVVRR